MSGDFDVQIRSERDVAVITVIGELDLATSSILERELDRAARDASLLVIDLRELVFMDSSGISVLVRAQRSAVEHRQRLGVVNCSPQVQRLLALTGVADMLTLEAIERF